ncbi:MAG: hypothetical protein AAF851_03815 [Myxococcota bacterium]
MATVALFGLPMEAVFGDLRPHDGLRAVRLRGTGRDAGRAKLISVTRALLRQRVRPGMDESEARARCPELEVRDRDMEREATLLGRAAEAIMVFGPEVEVQAPGLIYVEIGRSLDALAGRFGGRPPTELDVGQAISSLMNELGHDVAVVISSDPDSGRTVVAENARLSRVGVEVVAEEDGPERVGQCSLRDLFWTDRLDDPEGVLASRLADVHRELGLLGLERVEDLARMGSMPARFSDVERLLRDRALARRRRPLRQYWPPDALVENFELDHGTENFEPLGFIGRRLVHRLVARLEGRGRAAQRLELTLTYEPGWQDDFDDARLRPRSSKRTQLIALDFARPTRDIAVVFAVLREKLLVPGFVTAIRLEAQDTEPDPGAQLELFHRHEHRIEEAAGLISRLQAALGARAVFSPRMCDRHRPEAAWTAAPFDLEQAFSKPSIVRPPSPALFGLPFAAEPAEDRALPEVEAMASVIGGEEGERVPEEPGLAPPGSWPKPVPRSAENEPPPILPPRPGLLLPFPRPARSRPEGLSWEGRAWRWVGEPEDFCAEWWLAEPLQRCYRVAESSDGRRLWAFFDAEGALKVHGIFD